MIAGIVIFSVIILFIIFVILFARAANARMIVKTDDLGITVRDGKFYLWNDVRRIKYFIVLGKFSKVRRLHSLHFYFVNGGRASISNLTQDIKPLLERATQMQVPKSERVVGYYRD